MTIVPKKGKVSLVSQSGVHQRRIFIFVLAAFHVIYSVVIIDLAKAKMKRWKSWELETTSLEYQFTNVNVFQVAFFRQFFASITKVDYLTLRHGFINAHFAPNSKFNFHKYIKRSMEDDLKVVVGIRLASLPFRLSEWIIREWLNSMLICDFLSVNVVNSAAFHCGYALSYSSF
ncbi:hypothetical protein NC653_019765 [Populus alba x Populus x berolinensis]|uniref:Uncharacterized protein n=1 Tax=Populus alba x Populus x berolinensis TaxID=444605 RepID=A0AAD6VXV8_9ROSI|nr:hypothetical protein NC653_019765 [Populus alba x Populus x berolinensis]